MIRTPLRWFKQLAAALVLLAGVVCCAEISLRVYDSYSGQVTRSRVYDRGLICKSWFVHHELKPLQRLRLPNPDGDGEVVLNTNRLGLRGPERAIPKPPGVYRVLCLGDERTLAVGVDEADTFCVRLQELLQTRSQARIEVINAGVPGYCPLLCCLLLEHKLLVLQPDLVILNFDMSDIADDYRYRRYAEMGDDGRPLACSHPGLEMRPPLGQPEANGKFLLPLWTKQNLGWLWTEKVLPPSPRGIDTPTGMYLWLEDEPPDWSMYIQQAMMPMESLRQLSEKAYAQFVVACAPAPWQVAADASDGEQVRERAGVPQGVVYRSTIPFETLASFLGERRIAFCDASPEFRASEEGAGLFLRNRAALSPAGHALYARTLAAFVIRNLRGAWGPMGSPGDSSEPAAGYPGRIRPASAQEPARHAFPR